LQKVTIIDKQSEQDFISYIKEDKPDYEIKRFGETHQVITSEFNVLIPQEYSHIIDEISPYSNDLIYGKNKTENVVSIEVLKDKVVLYKNDGSTEVRKMVYWILSNQKIDSTFSSLEGNLHYKYIKRFTNKGMFSKAASRYQKMGKDIFVVWNDKESAMIYHGITQFKGLKVSDVSVLSFDIESAGLTMDKDSKTFLITNTFRDIDGSITKKHFRVDNYNNNDVEMIRDWCKWVVKIDPTVITGHNIFRYDFPYLIHCAKKGKYTLELGKKHKKIVVSSKVSSKRVDGGQSWDYKKIQIFGRHIIDGQFIALQYDIGRKYVSWGLKQIAEQEGFINEDRQFYDASLIGKNWYDPIEREKIVAYGIDDSDDSLKIYDLMIPSIFYMTQSIPKPFQIMGTSASGAQLNAVMVRAYMQDRHSIPKTNEHNYVAGGMSHGVPGVYSNVVKFDAASFYPSTILAFDIHDPDKDPKAYFLEMVRFFTHKRFEQKGLYKKTGDSYYDDLQAASKVFINSSYGLLGTNGLNFNSFENAALITKCCRKSLQKAIVWATGRDVSYWWDEYSEKKTSEQDFEDYSFIDSKSEVSFEDMKRHDWNLVNCDTDAIGFTKKDESEFTSEEVDSIRSELNTIMYSEWEDDGEFSRFLVIKAKNYVMEEKGSGKISYKGSSLKTSSKEPVLKEMLHECIDDLMKGRGNLLNIYHKYVREAYNIEDISRWVTKKSVTKAVLNPARTNERKVLDALRGMEIREGDKVWLYSAIDGKTQKKVKGKFVFLKSGKPKMIDNCILRIQDKWKGDEDKMHYVKRVHDTMMILENVIDKELYLKYNNKGNLSKLEEL
jgi:DNA polymerase elongation subunit (family B)